MGQQEKVATSLAGTVGEEISASLAPVDAELARRYPGDPGTRQPVHTVYVPADAFTADTIRAWGDQALAALDEHAPDAAVVRRGPRPPARARRAGPRPGTRQAGARAGRGPAHRLRGRLRRRARTRRRTRPPPARPAWSPRRTPTGPRAPYMGIRMKCMEAAVRDRGIRTLDIFLTGLMRGRRPARRARPHAAQGHATPNRSPRWCGCCEAFERDARPAGRPPRLRDPDRDQPVHPRPRRHRHRGPDDRRRRGPGHRAALRHLRLQRLPRCQRRLPGQRPPRRRPRQGRHAGRRRGHRRTASATARPTCSRSAPPSRSTRPGGCTTGSPAALWPARTTRAGTCTRATCPPATRPSTPSTARAWRPGRGAARRVCGQGRRRRAWTSPPPPRRSAATCCAASTAARWTPRGRPAHRADPRGPGRLRLAPARARLTRDRPP